MFKKHNESSWYKPLVFIKTIFIGNKDCNILPFDAKLLLHRQWPGPACHGSYWPCHGGLRLPGSWPIKVNISDFQGCLFLHPDVAVELTGYFLGVSTISWQPGCWCTKLVLPTQNQFAREGLVTSSKTYNPVNNQMCWSLTSMQCSTYLFLIVRPWRMLLSQKCLVAPGAPSVR